MEGIAMFWCVIGLIGLAVIAVCVACVAFAVYFAGCAAKRIQEPDDESENTDRSWTLPFGIVDEPGQKGRYKLLHIARKNGGSYFFLDRNTATLCWLENAHADPGTPVVVTEAEYQETIAMPEDEKDLYTYPNMPDFDTLADLQQAVISLVDPAIAASA